MILQFSLLNQRRDEKRMTLVTFGMSLFQQFFISSFFLCWMPIKSMSNIVVLSPSRMSSGVNSFVLNQFFFWFHSATRLEMTNDFGKESQKLQWRMSVLIKTSHELFHWSWEFVYLLAPFAYNNYFKIKI